MSATHGGCATSSVAASLSTDRGMGAGSSSSSGNMGSTRAAISASSAGARLTGSAETVTVSVKLQSGQDCRASDGRAVWKRIDPKRARAACG